MINLPKRTTSMTTEFVSLPIKKIRAISATADRKVAAIAYVTKDHAGFDESDIVISLECGAHSRTLFQKRE